MYYASFKLANVVIQSGKLIGTDPFNVGWIGESPAVIISGSREKEPFHLFPW